MYITLVEKAWKYHGIPWKKHGENSMEILEIHGNPAEQNTMVSMGYLPCFSKLAWGKWLRGKHIG